MTVSIEYAAEHLADILSAVDSGEAVEITRPNKPAVLLQQQSAPFDAAPQGKRALGARKGLLRVPSDGEWEVMDREWRASFMHKSDGVEAS